MHCPRHAFQFDYRVLYCLHAALCTVLLKRAGTARNGTPNSTLDARCTVLFCTARVLCCARVVATRAIASHRFRFVSFRLHSRPPLPLHRTASPPSRPRPREGLCLTHAVLTCVALLYIYTVLYNNTTIIAPSNLYTYFHLLPLTYDYSAVQCSPAQYTEERWALTRPPEARRSTRPAMRYSTQIFSNTDGMR